jgi:hypothetical protein
MIFACSPDEDARIEVNSVTPPDLRAELNRFFNNGKEAFQNFSFDVSQAQEIKGAGGTVLTIPANAFIHPSGQAISGNVTVSLREMYSPGALIFNNAATISNGQILSSGGSFELQVQQNGADLRLANGAQIGVQVPTDSVDPNMQLFTSNGRDTTNQVAWQAQNITVVDTVIDTTGTGGGGGQGGSGQNLVDSLYTFQLSSLFRFINCDYFWNDPRPLTEVTIRVDSAMTYQNTRVLVYLPSVNALVPVYNFQSPDFLINGGYRLPVGINAVFIAINVDNLGIYQYAIQQNTVAQNHLEIMNFQTITQAQLTQLLNSL